MSQNLIQIRQINQPQLSGFITGVCNSLYLQLDDTGVFVDQPTLAASGAYLEALISASSAGVGAINGQSGLLNVYCSGVVTIFNSGGNFYIGYTGSQNTGINYNQLSNYLATGNYSLNYPNGYLLTFLEGAGNESILLLPRKSGEDTYYIASSAQGGFLLYPSVLSGISSYPLASETGLHHPNGATFSDNSYIYTSNGNVIASSEFLTYRNATTLAAETTLYYPNAFNDEIPLATPTVLYAPALGIIGQIPIANTSGLILPSDVVRTTGNQTISGIKTFTTGGVLSGNWFTNTAPTSSGHIVNKGYLDQTISGVSGNFQPFSSKLSVFSQDGGVPSPSGQTQFWKSLESGRLNNKPFHVVYGFDSMSSDNLGNKWPTFFDQYIRASVGNAGIGFRSAYYALTNVNPAQWFSIDALSDATDLAALAPMAANSAFTRYGTRVGSGRTANETRTFLKLPGIASKIYVWYAERYSGLPFTIRATNGTIVKTIYSGNVGGTSGGTVITIGTPPVLAVASIDVLPQDEDHIVSIEVDGTTAGSTINVCLYGVAAWNPNVFGVVTHQCAYSGGTFANFITSWNSTAKTTWFNSILPDLALTVFGVNDSGSTEPTIQSQAESFIQNLRSLRPNIAIEWVGPLQAGDYQVAEQKVSRAVSAAINSQNSAASVEFGRFTDLGPLYSPSGAIQAGLMSAPGDVHPTNIGYEWMGSAIYDFIGAGSLERFADPLTNYPFNAPPFYNFNAGSFVSGSFLEDSSVLITALSGFNNNSSSSSNSYLSDSTNFPVTSNEKIFALGRASANSGNSGLRIRLSLGAFFDVPLNSTPTSFCIPVIPFAAGSTTSRLELRPLSPTTGGNVNINQFSLIRETELYRQGIAMGSGVPTGYSTSLDQKYYDYSSGSWYLAKPGGAWQPVSGISKPKSESISFFTPIVYSGLNQQEVWINETIVATGLRVGALTLGSGLFSLSGALYQRDNLNNTSIIQNFTLGTGSIYTGINISNLTITGYNRVGFNITNSLSGIQNLTLGLFGYSQ